MNAGSNDPNLDEFLRSMQPMPPKQAETDSPELQRFFAESRRKPYRRPMDSWTKGGIGIVILLIAIRILIKMLAN
jgi:hypothetical protein